MLDLSGLKNTKLLLIFPDRKRGVSDSLGCQHFHLFLFGSEFTLVTDHKLLEIILDSVHRHPTIVEKPKRARYKLVIIERRNKLTANFNPEPYKVVKKTDV